MNKLTITTILGIALCTFTPATAHNNKTDSLSVQAEQAQDTLRLSVEAWQTEIQMSFLMQGLNIIVATPTGDTLASLAFPDASEVRELMHHHPNEVKETKDRNSGREVRPDLLPLTKALSQLPVNMTSGDTIIKLKSYRIEIDKEKQTITFSVGIPLTAIPQIETDHIYIEILSEPDKATGKEEYTGQCLSGRETRKRPGLGQPPSAAEFPRRNIRIRRRIPIIHFMLPYLCP